MQTSAAGEARALQEFNYRGCEIEVRGKTMSKTMSVRMDRNNSEFLHEITKEERSDLSKTVRDMVTRGRILLAAERYKKGEASLGRGWGSRRPDDDDTHRIWGGEHGGEGRLSSGA
jgi:hypothetical protein